MDLLEDFKDFISKHSLFDSSVNLLLAVSGGVDSVVMCDLCHHARLSFDIAHINFGLRGADSDGDELFVKRLAEKYAVRFFTIRFETEKIAEQRKTGIQETARILRYDWLLSIAEENGYGHILTAHHADDNAETILMNFLKGTGYRGLRGMKPIRSGIGGRIARPLLFARKQDIIFFAKHHQLNWREDASNTDSFYTRNHMRNEWLPLVEQVIPEVRENLLDNINRFNELAQLCDWAIHFQLKKLGIKKGLELHIPVNKLLKTPAFTMVLFEMIRSYGFTPGQLKDAQNLLHAASGKYVESAEYRLIKNRNWLIISPIKIQHVPLQIINSDEQDVVLPIGKLSVKKWQLPVKVSHDVMLAQVDADQVVFPLIIRRWKTGDYFYPLGMRKKKKLSRFFIDNKLSLTEKENIWVVESEKKIIWVIGHRIDDRVKLQDSTKAVLCISLAPAQ